MAKETKEMTKEELIAALERACDLFEEIQRQEAVKEAEEIIKQAEGK